MLDFFEYFEYKHAPSFPGPDVDLNTYKGLSTSDSRLFVKYKPYDKWYRVNNLSIIKFKQTFEESCDIPTDDVVFIQLCITTNVLEETK